MHKSIQELLSTSYMKDVFKTKLKKSMILSLQQQDMARLEKFAENWVQVRRKVRHIQRLQIKTALKVIGTLLQQKRTSSIDR